MAKVSQKRLDEIAKYDAENTVQIKLKLNKKTDSDIINKLDSVPNKQGYIKGLVREDIKNEAGPAGAGAAAGKDTENK